MINSRFATSFPRVSAITILVSLAGCKVGPDYKAPEQHAAPAAFAALRDAAEANPGVAPSSTGALTSDSIATWWQNFEDPELDSLIERAIAANLDLKVAEARVREARANLGVSRSGLYPTVAANGSATRSRVSANLAHQFPGSATANLFDVGLDASWEIDVFGGVRRGVEASEASLQSTVENQRDVLISVLAEVAASYVDLRGFQQRVKVSEEIISASQQSVDLTSSRFRAGLAADLEVAQAQGLLAGRQADLPSLRAGMHDAAYRLGILLGQTPEALLDELTQVGSIPKIPSVVPVGLPSDLLTRRPDIRRAQRSLASATAQIGVATADLYPRFSLTGSFGMQAAKADKLGDIDSRFWSFGPAVRWDLFSGGRIRSEIRAAGARQEQALYAYDQSILNALGDVETAITNFIQEQARRSALAAAVEADTRAVESLTDRYRSGVGDFLSVLIAQRALFDVQDQLVQSDALVSRNLIALYKALGGGWTEEQENGTQEQPAPGNMPEAPAPASTSAQPASNG